MNVRATWLTHAVTLRHTLMGVSTGQDEGTPTVTGLSLPASDQVSEVLAAPSLCGVQKCSLSGLECEGAEVRWYPSGLFTALAGCPGPHLQSSLPLQLWLLTGPVAEAEEPPPSAGGS